MNKVYGSLEWFAFVRTDRSRLIVAYDCQPEPDGTYATWNEIYFYKKPHPVVTHGEIKEAIINDINAATDEKILKGFVWNDIPVWLSAENQRNLSEAQRMAEKYGDSILPLRFKLGETQEGTPVYHVFETTDELDDFYTKAFAFVNQCLNDGWNLKDSIDWSVYEL